jgi:hypothetical protein
MATALRGFNESILAFARLPENQALLPKTRSYSTPFRGSYSSKWLLNQAVEAMRFRPVDVLVMGSNPNDLGDTPAATRYRSLEDQMASGFYGEAYWSPEGKPAPGWSPFADKKPGWRLLTAAIGSTSQATFCNYLPWGSRDLQDLAAKTEPKLLDRVVQFSDDLFEDIILALRPRVVVVPKSLTGGALGGRSRLAEHRQSAREVVINYFASGERRRFLLQVGPLKVGEFETKLIHLAHPSSWRIPADYRVGMKRALAKMLH